MENDEGYTTNDLKNHLESQFRDGMSWDNIGKWHINHIIQFNSYKDEEFQKCWSLSNLQPLWASENISKGAKYNNELE